MSTRPPTRNLIDEAALSKAFEHVWAIMRLSALIEEIDIYLHQVRKAFSAHVAPATLKAVPTHDAAVVESEGA